MHRASLSTIVLLAFAASAVLGLCAMTQQMIMHGGLCATDGIGSMVCPENPILHFSLLASLLAVFSVIVSLALVGFVPVDRAIYSTPRRRNRVLLSWALSPGLQPLFSDGILNPKTF